MPRKPIDDVTVRVATPDDFEGVMALCMQVAKENGIFQPDVPKVAGDIWPTLHQSDGLIGVIGPVGGELEGMVILKLGSLWYSSDRIVEERFVFVPSKFRRASGGRARRLCQFTKRVADELNMPLIIGVFQTVEQMVKCDFMKVNLDHRLAGSFYTKQKPGPGLINLRSK
jgi:hypothetical protein